MARGPQALSIQIQKFVQWAFPLANLFLKSILWRKNWRGGVGELLLKNGKIDGYAY